MRGRNRRMGATVLCMALAWGASAETNTGEEAQGAAGRLAQYAGDWSGYWRGGKKTNAYRVELRLEAPAEGMAAGAWCQFRSGDDSMWWMDLADYELEESDDHVQWERGRSKKRKPDRYRITPGEETLSVHWARKGKSKWHEARMQPETEPRCLQHLRPKDARVPHQKQGEGMTGAWNDGEGGEMLLHVDADGALAGQVCYRRGDGSGVLWRFGPQERIKAQKTDQGWELKRRPLKVTMTHAWTIDAEGAARYTEKPKGKKIRRYALTRGTLDDGCLARVATEMPSDG